MVGIQYLWTKGLCRISDHLWRHGIREIHRQESYIDILQRFHLRDIFRIAGNITPHVSERDHISISGAFRMERHALASFMNNIVGRHRLDRESFYRIYITILHDYAVLALL